MLKKEMLEERGIVRATFELPAAVQGDSAHLVGDFTSWQGVPMERLDDGRWRTTLDLEPGRSYEFRYLIDGERWENDWAADRYVRNPFGHENSVIETPTLEAASGRAARSGQGAPRGRSRGAGTTGSAAKKAAANKSAAKKSTAKKAATTQAAAKKTAAKKSTAKKAAAKRTDRKPDGESSAT